MADGENYDHILLRQAPEVNQYTALGGGGADKEIRVRSLNEHGNRVKQMLNQVKSISEKLAKRPLPENIDRDDGIYVEFESAIGYDLIVDSLHKAQSGIDLLKVDKFKKVDPETDELKDLTKAVVFIQEGKVDIFIRMVERYLTELHPKSNRPKGEKFVNSIQNIRVATLRSFWTDPIDFPEQQEQIWWEVWLRRYSKKNELSNYERVINQAQNIGIEVSERVLEFPEHHILLMNGNAEQLSKSILLLNSLAELRKAKVRADFFTEELDGLDQEEWIGDAVQRLNIQDDERPIICLLDSGVTNGHPLLDPIIPNHNLDTINPAWGSNDSMNGTGHGTLMAGTALFGDITTILANRNQIDIYHDIESVKIINPNSPNDPENYGAITEEAVSRSVVLNGVSDKIYCMAVSAKDDRDMGKPSSWSSAVDKIVFSEEDLDDKDDILFFLSSGNVNLDNSDEYPIKNKIEQIHDPGQAWNALTVGSYTQKNNVNTELYPNSTVVAPFGKMSPSNSTSLSWDPEWPYKPELVLEGGNLSKNDNNDLILDHNLRLLSTSRSFNIKPLAPFGGTSAASAQASRLASIIKNQYPSFWSETIRGLLVHNAEWTTQMMGGKSLRDLTRDETQGLLRSVGYGVPNLAESLYSAENSLTLVAQNSFKPFRIENNDVKTDEIHLYELPWPREQLLALGETDVKLKVTLSYYIEPNPGNRFYSSKFYYQSHGLRFDVKRVGDTVEQFRKRRNREIRDDNYSSPDTETEEWLIGFRKRTFGSIHKDIWFGTAADLATKEHVMVYPVTGWWRKRKGLERYDSRTKYSLIVSIETPPTGIDIYTPVRNKVVIEV